MTALAKDRIARTKANPATRHNRAALAAGAVIFLGGLIAKNAAGNVVAASDAASLKVIGVAEENADNSAGIAGAVSVGYATGLGVELLNDGGAILLASQFEPCYVADDQSVTTSAIAAHDVLVGIVTEFTTTKVWVYVDENLSSAVLAAPLSGAGMATVADAQVLGGMTELFVITVGDVASGDTDVVVTEKCEVIDFWVQKINGAGAANTATLKNGANAISSALACAVDNAITRAVSLDDAFTPIAAGGTLRVSHVKAAGTGDLRAFVVAIKRA